MWGPGSRLEVLIEHYNFVRILLWAGRKNLWLNPAQSSRASTAPMVRVWKGKTEVRRCVIRRWIPTLRAECGRIKLEIPQQRMGRNTFGTDLHWIMCLRKDPAKTSLLSWWNKTCYSWKMAGLETVLFLFIAGFPSFLPFPKEDTSSAFA